MQYYPESYTILHWKYQGEDVIKVFGSWRGGYTSGDSWKLSSGTTSIAYNDNLWYFKQYSGSCYVLRDDPGVHGMWQQGILQDIMQNIPGCREVSIAEAAGILLDK